MNESLHDLRLGFDSFSGRIGPAGFWRTSLPHGLASMLGSGERSMTFGGGDAGSLRERKREITSKKEQISKSVNLHLFIYMCYP